MDKEELEKLIDEYGNLAYKRDLLLSEKQKLKDSVIPAEVKLELESIDAEFEDKEKALDLEEKTKKKIVESAIDKYAQPMYIGKEKIQLKTQLMTLSISEPEITWNSDALDAYALGHPELLQFRVQGKNKTRLMRNK